jgi:hypothetical protein
LIGSWTISTFFFIPHASACWCSGRWPMSSAWILYASAIIWLRFAWSISEPIFSVSSSSFGLLYQPRLNCPCPPLPSAGGVAISAFSGSCASVVDGVQPSR